MIDLGAQQEFEDNFLCFRKLRYYSFCFSRRFFLRLRFSELYPAGLWPRKSKIGQKWTQNDISDGWEWFGVFGSSIRSNLVWGSRVWDKMIFGWVFTNLRPFSPCNNFVIKFITNLLHRILTPNVVFTHQIDWKWWVNLTMHTTRQWELLGWCFEKTRFSFWPSHLE